MFKGFRALARLLEQLGDDRLNALVSSDNMGKVKAFCDGLIEDTALPTELTNIGPEKRSYDILGFLRGNEKWVESYHMVKRAKRIGAHLGEDDAEYLLDNQQDIPVVLRGKVSFAFTDWCDPGVPEYISTIIWEDDKGWTQYFYCDDWYEHVRVLRRK